MVQRAANKESTQGKQVFVTKASGEKELFDPEKIRRTCIHAGATQELADEVVEKVTAAAYDGIPTRKVLQMTVHLLAAEMPHVAARYDLKGAIMRLGPAGFVFEELVAEILNRYGYATRTNVFVNGACVEHEIDIVAEKAGSSVIVPTATTGSTRAMIECKYHNQPGVYTGLKEALYTWARFLDLREGFSKGKCQSFEQVWLVSNTKFSDRCTRYAACKGLVLLGWNFPHERSLKKLLEEKNLYPITVLRKLDKLSQDRLASAGLMLCEDLVEKTPSELGRRTNIPTRTLKILIEEARDILTKRKM